MAVNKNSNGFTFFFAIAMVIVFGAVLAILKLQLKPMQDANAAIKKKMDILGAIQVESTRDNAEVLFDQYIAEAYIIDTKGQKVPESGMDAAIAIDVKKDYRSGVSKMVKQFKGDPEGFDAALSEVNDLYFPVFIGKRGDTTLTVVPMVGSGLWGPIWGFVSVQDDYKTIYGCKFDHKTETPGLGAEIKQDIFLDRFQQGYNNQEGYQQRSLEPGAKKIFEVTKGGSSPKKPNQVEGITGGTITSKGVEEMMNRTFGVYYKHFQGQGQLGTINR